MKPTLALATLALAVGVASPSAAAVPETTEPGVVYPVKTTLTAKKVVVARDKFTRNGLPRYPRGAVIRFELRNTGTKPVVFQIWDQKTAPIKPGKRDSILVNWVYRGKFVYRQIWRGKTLGARGYVTIF